MEDLAEVFSTILHTFDGNSLGNLRLTSRSMYELVEASSVVLRPRRHISSKPRNMVPFFSQVLEIFFHIFLSTSLVFHCHKDASFTKTKNRDLTADMPPFSVR